MFLVKEIFKSKEFQKEAPRKLKHIVRKVHRETERKNLQEVRKDNQKKNVA